MFDRINNKRHIYFTQLRHDHEKYRPVDISPDDALVVRNIYMDSLIQNSQDIIKRSMVHPQHTNTYRD